MSEKSFSSNYDLYKVFYYVAQYKSLTKAAAELNVSQPAVSQSIKQLESILGVKLTARTGHGIKLTPDGELIFPYIKKGCEAFNAAEAALFENVLANSDTAKSLSADSAPTVTAKTRRTRTNTTKHVPKAKTPIQDCFVTGTQYLHFAGQKLPYRLLEHLPIILPKGEDSVRNNLDTFLKSIGVKIYPLKEYESYKDILNGAIHNEGIACLPYPFVEAELKAGNVYLLEFETDIPKRNN